MVTKPALDCPKACRPAEDPAYSVRLKEQESTCLTQHQTVVAVRLLCEFQPAAAGDHSVATVIN
jgi:hypothetical protein